MPALVEIDEPSPGVRRLTLSRPEALNTLNASLVAELHSALDAIAADRDVRVVVLTGAGRAFCAGLDLNGYGDPERVEEMGPTLGSLDRQREIAGLVEKLHTLPQPVIAAVNGAAAGGGLALVCASDIRIAAEESVYAVAFIRAGYSACDIGVSWLLPRIVGAGHAHELMLTGRKFDAAEAERIGLITQVVADDALMATVLAKAEEILRNPPASVALTKQGMWLALEMPSLRAGIELENRQQVITALTEDQPEATRAFLEKRSPDYKHR
ncbi:enoyl-CoA hydratase/isomerase family protein [Nocardioides sp. AE5]|uniref:enoyl-CoA hydratase/isomerase family protein n=1 Tax=Nocardioides sp. AE5 TaxID=2962573 RepID=UPI002880ECFB|nr:enoyl-CoA hydratase/isomerase family protein [Nocardioides sp. AE5]MDT0203243.1 enoyl-CoA hydratase/isomerase family protein [Nocardioides sp. AE5]